MTERSPPQRPAKRLRSTASMRRSRRRGRCDEEDGAAAFGLLASMDRVAATRVGLMCRLAFAIDPRSAGPLAACSRHGRKPGGPMSTLEVKVPDIGDFKDVPVIEVFVKPGDVGKAEGSLVTLESDKATMDVQTPGAG